MLVRIPTKQDEYYNILQLAWMFFMAEFLVAMEYISVFTREPRSWNFRRIFWYTVGAVPALVIVTIFTIAAVKFILK